MTLSLPQIKSGPPPEPARPAHAAGGHLPTHATSPRGRRIPVLRGPQKAAILVRLLIAQGAEINLAALPDEMQTALTEQLAEMRLVDRDTMEAVISEFIETLEQIGLSFAGGIDGAIKALDGKLSPAAVRRLRELAAGRGSADPWERLAAAELDELTELLQPESAEVAAVALSKLTVKKAAALLERMPGERARRVAYAISLTGGIAPQTVTRIGKSLALQLDQRPPRAFEAPPSDRVGAILNLATSQIRDRLLAELDEEDQGFAAGVRKAIFTFGHIHSRLQPRDVPRVLRDVPQPELISALAAALGAGETNEAKSAEFLLANMSQRMAATLREEAEALGPVKASVAEAAMAAVADAVRGLLDAGEITLVDQDD
ncbi:FliG C-terminal domain-containing protein [Pararhodobacter sp. SW119]|uniref:FliG C-terminal domain-containing protein n=1 Tax=Pararhodobacter sp. SW119 TaxID=2780075 RepID=UPI001ADEDE75|nr:FliG C-terminal domain-containing protein [Pararhodobacter sp. SW119]